jgi:hypothetical protein
MHGLKADIVFSNSYNERIFGTQDRGIHSGAYDRHSAQKAHHPSKCFNPFAVKWNCSKELYCGKSPGNPKIIEMPSMMILRGNVQLLESMSQFKFKFIVVMPTLKTHLCKPLHHGWCLVDWCIFPIYPWLQFSRMYDFSHELGTLDHLSFVYQLSH